MGFRQIIGCAQEDPRRRRTPLGAFLGAALVLLAGVGEARTEEGLRPALTLDAVYTGEVFGNAHGGLRRTTRYLDNLDLQITLDAEAAFGWKGATFFAYGLYNNGRPFSEDVLGDAQVASNIETGVRAVRLYEAWWDQTIGDTSLRLGLYDLNSEFDAGDLRSLFINSTHGIAQDYSQSGLNGPSIFPSTSLSLRLDHHFTPEWYVRAAVLDGVPNDPDHPKRTTIRLGNDGALLAAEAGYHDGPKQIYLGIWRYT
jgi:porin